RAGPVRRTGGAAPRDRAVPFGAGDDECTRSGAAGGAAADPVRLRRRRRCARPGAARGERRDYRWSAPNTAARISTTTMTMTMTVTMTAAVEGRAEPSLLSRELGGTNRAFMLPRSRSGDESLTRR